MSLKDQKRKTGKTEFGTGCAFGIFVLAVTALWAMITDHQNAEMIGEFAMGMTIPLGGCAAASFGMNWHHMQSKWRASEYRGDPLSDLDNPSNEYYGR